jgi:hypothetical protein
MRRKATLPGTSTPSTSTTVEKRKIANQLAQTPSTHPNKNLQVGETCVASYARDILCKGSCPGQFNCTATRVLQNTVDRTSQYIVFVYTCTIYKSSTEYNCPMYCTVPGTIHCWAKFRTRMYIKGNLHVLLLFVLSSTSRSIAQANTEYNYVPTILGINRTSMTYRL